MSNVYLKVTIEKNWRSQNFDFPSFWAASTHADINKFWNFLLQINNQRSGNKSVFCFSIILFLKGTFKVKESTLLVEQKYKL